MTNELILEFAAPREDYIITFEDDGKVGYAYLKKEKKIVAAVWLYNRCQTPTIAEWKDPANIPFANCEGYMSEGGRLNIPVSQGDVVVTWQYEDGLPVANIYIFKELYGVLDTDYKVGYARFAVKDGPIARIMEIE